LSFKFGRGLLGPTKPLLGRWVHRGVHIGQAVQVEHAYEPWGRGRVRLAATWTLPDRTYAEIVWLRGDGGPGLDFADENQGRAGWNRFLMQRFELG